MSDDLREFLARAVRERRGAAAGARVLRLDELERSRGAEAVTSEWGLAALRGRLVELSARGASATLTSAFEIVLEAQTAGEPVAWIAPSAGSFFPPDASASGIDLAALVVVRVTDAVMAARAAERLLRSGAFGLVVIDLESLDQEPALSMVHQGRLVTLAQTHDAAIVCLTEKTADGSSVGSLVSLRIEALRTRVEAGEHELSLRALKDKRRGPGWERKHKVPGPSGMG